MNRRTKRLAVNRSRLRAGLPALRVETASGLRHARLVKILGPAILAQVKVHGKWFAYVLTDADVELVS